MIKVLQQLKRRSPSLVIYLSGSHGDECFIGPRWPLIGCGDKTFLASPPITAFELNSSCWMGEADIEKPKYD